MPFPAIPTQVKCPRCNITFATQVRTIIDVGEEPELKEQFLRGQLNYARCPQCGGGGLLNTALVYHDPTKELLITYVPAELNMPADQQEQFVGSLVNAVMNARPPEERKAYFLQPKAALTMDSLYDAILEADGVSKEALEAQRSRLKLINTFLAAVDDEKTLDKLVEEHRAELTYEFFLVLSDAIEAHEADGHEDRAKALQALRERLLQRVTPAMPAASPQVGTYDELIELLHKAKAGSDWRTTIAMNRPRLDYGFFQALTAKIEAAQQGGDANTAQKLTELRRQILEELSAQDRKLREAEDAAGLLLMQLSEAQDLEAEVRKHSEEIDEALIGLLVRYQEAAKARNDVARAEKLGRILDTVLTVLEEKLPPDVRLINKLLRAPYPEGTNVVLEASRGLLNDAFLEACDKYIADLEQARDKELAEHLKAVRSQVAAKMSILRA
jgi:hypothetical protein